MITSRRSFLIGLGAAIAAPAIEGGTDVHEIRRLVTRKDGSMFQATLINRVAWQARAAGDKRAVRRKKRR